MTGKNSVSVGDIFTVNPRLIKAVQLKAGGTQYTGFSSFYAYSSAHPNNKTTMLIQSCTSLKVSHSIVPNNVLSNLDWTKNIKLIFLVNCAVLVWFLHYKQTLSIRKRNQNFLKSGLFPISYVTGEILKDNILEIKTSKEHYYHDVNTPTRSYIIR